jgi:hypothetical protein
VESTDLAALIVEAVKFVEQELGDGRVSGREV